MATTPQQPDDGSTPDELELLRQEVNAVPANDFNLLQEDILLPFSTPEESQRRIKIEIDHAMEVKELDTFQVFERVQLALEQHPAVAAEHLETFDYDTCTEWIENGLPMEDSIWMQAFQSALDVRLVDL
jgi:hypothetical protein